jgi:dephospho-CoA kinase
MESSGPIQVGVTGGIGAGKSVVCQLFRCLGVPVYDADQRAKWLTNNDPFIRKEVIDLLGPESFTKAGDYNRQFVASKVFKDSTLLYRLNQIIHPRVFEDTEKWLQRHESQPYVVKEAALMNKAGENNTLDFVVVVKADMEVRLARIKVRDSFRSEEEIKSIIQRQISDEERALIADFTIKNNDDSPLIPAVNQLHTFFFASKIGI